MLSRACAALWLFLAVSSLNQYTEGFSLGVLPLAKARCQGRAPCGSRRPLSVTMGLEGKEPRPTRHPSQRDSPDTGATRLDGVASNPMDVPSTPALRPLLPAERNIGAGVEGFNAGLIDLLKGFMLRYYGERTYARFYALETIARVPYFGYLCVLHLYETLGRWRQAEYLRVHFAESYNELHHLLIMEELGGNHLFWDRWFAQHAAFFYFFVVVLLYLANPRHAYNLNQHVEEHAYATYDAFLAENGEDLKKQPAPMIARKYYGRDVLYVFNGLYKEGIDDARFEQRDKNRPAISNLFDTFVAVRNDEWEHVKTMKALQDDVASER